MNWAHALIVVAVVPPLAGMLTGWAIKHYSPIEREKRAIRRKRKQRRNALRVLRGPVHDDRNSISVFRNMGRQ